MVSLLRCEDFPLFIEEAQALWDEVRSVTGCVDDIVSIQCVDEQEMQTLNARYRGKHAPTNVLTFSYESEHDIAICMEVAKREANERNVDIRDYTALLVVHACLHAAGLDHDRSPEEADRTREYERIVLAACGFVSQALSDVY